MLFLLLRYWKLDVACDKRLFLTIYILYYTTLEGLNRIRYYIVTI